MLFGFGIPHIYEPKQGGFVLRRRSQRIVNETLGDTCRRHIMAETSIAWFRDETPAGLPHLVVLAAEVYYGSI